MAENTAKLFVLLGEWKLSAEPGSPRGFPGRLLRVGKGQVHYGLLLGWLVGDYKETKTKEFLPDLVREA